MAEKPQTEQQEPAPRPPRQPDPSLITYIEKGDDPDTAETRDEKASD